MTIYRDPLRVHQKPAFYFFFLQSYHLPRLLHFFPTRRSSDLSRAAAACNLALSGPSSNIEPTTTASGRPRRSEEHTSELQSLTNIVCRLLLEKKKVKYKIDIL